MSNYICIFNDDQPVQLILNDCSENQMNFDYVPLNNSVHFYLFLLLLLLRKLGNCLKIGGSNRPA